MTENTLTLEQTFSTLKTHAKEFNVDIDDNLVAACTTYARLLLKENEKTNLTRLTSPRDCMIGMFLDSLLFLRHLKPKKSASILDIGTGGGFPGMILALASEKFSVTAIDSRHKKTDFITMAANTMQVKNIVAVHTRAQELESEKFDYVVARAVGSLSKSMRLAKPHLKKRGSVIVACSEKSFDPSLKKKLRMNLKSFPYILPGYTNTFTHVIGHNR